MGMQRRLVFDGQVFQTAAWHRGMGKYSLELLSELDKLNQKKQHWESLSILFSDKLPQEADVLKSLKERVPHAEVTTIELMPNEIGNSTIIERNRKVVDEYIAAQPEATKTIVDYVVLSLLQGEIFPAFPSGANVNKVLLYYDLIPLMMHNIYLSNPITRTEYLSKFAELFRADHYLSISKTGANDLSLYLGVDPARISNIDGGPIDHSNEAEPIDIPKPFILMPTGNDLRKNNRRGILGFGQFNQRHNNKYTLVITSYFKDFEIEELSKLAPNVVFTGNIKGEVLNYLYEEADALLFPTEYEGLGLPNLEAAGKNKPIACSDIAVFREMTLTDFVYFNPKYPTEIANALDVVTAKDYKVNKGAYKKLLSRYTWASTARVTTQALLSSEGSNITAVRPKVAMFGSDPSRDFGVARHMQEAHAELSRRLSIDYFLEGRSEVGELRVNFLPYVGKVVDTTRRADVDLELYDAVLYNIYNHPECQSTIFCALGTPGIALLHDLDLEDAWTGLCENSKLIHKTRLELEQDIDRKYGTEGTNYLVSVIARQKAIVVFSERAKEKVQAILEKLKKETPVYVLRAPASELVYEDILPAKERKIGYMSEGVLPTVLTEGSLAGLSKVIMSPLSEVKVVEAAGDAEIVAEPTDFEYIDALSRLKFVCSADERAQHSYMLLDALKFGTVPVILKESQLAILESEYKLLATEVNKEPKVSAKAKLGKQAAEAHSTKQYAQMLAEIVRDIGKE